MIKSKFADPECAHCRGTGWSWHGGQGGDYEACECRRAIFEDGFWVAPDGVKFTLESMAKDYIDKVMK